MKVSNKTRLFCRHEQLRHPAKKWSLLPLAEAVNADDFGGTFHLSRMDRKSLPVHQKSAQFVTHQRFSLSIRPCVAEALGFVVWSYDALIYQGATTPLNKA